MPKLLEIVKDHLVIAVVTLDPFFISEWIV